VYVGWFYSAVTGMSSYLKVILKDSLRSVPIFGWATQILLYIFLGRKKETDIPHIRAAMSYLLLADKKVLFLLFPEGNAGYYSQYTFIKTDLISLSLRYM